MAANAYATPIKQALQFFSRTCSVFTEEDSGYAPDPGQFSVAQQVAHVAQTINWFIEGGFSDGGFDMDFGKQQVAIREVKSLKEAFLALAAAVDEATAVLEAKTQEEMMTPISDPHIMTGEPRAAIVGAIMEHTAHHRGALAVYARLLGYSPPMPYSE